MSAQKLEAPGNVPLSAVGRPQGTFEVDANGQVLIAFRSKCRQALPALNLISSLCMVTGNQTM
jgi:hypothetical protein